MCLTEKRRTNLEGVAVGPWDSQAWVWTLRENPTFAEDLPRCFLRILSLQFLATRMLRLQILEAQGNSTAAYHLASVLRANACFEAYETGYLTSK